MQRQIHSDNARKMFWDLSIITSEVGNRYESAFKAPVWQLIMKTIFPRLRQTGDLRLLLVFHPYLRQQSFQ